MYDVDKMRFWCQKIIPLVYEDSLSYYETLCKVVKKLNEVIESVDNIPEYIAELISTEHLQDIMKTLLVNLENQIASANEGLNETATADRPVGTLVWLNGYLYRTKQYIDAGDRYVVNGNVEKITIEDCVKDIMLAITDNYEDGERVASEDREAGELVWFKNQLLYIKQDIEAGNAYTDTNSEVVDFSKLFLSIHNQIVSEATARANADTALGTRIDGEITARENADTTLGERITNEATARANADIALLNSLHNSVMWVTPEMFGGVGDGDTDDTQSIQDAIDSLADGGCIIFDSKTYKCDGELTVPVSIIFKGVGRNNSIIKYTGDNLFIDQTDGDILGFEDISVIGVGSSEGSICVTGSRCFDAYNNSFSINSGFHYWYTVSRWKGGYYNKFYNTVFKYIKNVFTNYDQNNLFFSGCAFSTFELGIDVVSGEGPLTLVGCSVELCANQFISGSHGRAINANIIGCYFENAPNEDCPEGIESLTGKFDHGVCVYTRGTEDYTINIVGCMLWADWFRFVYCDNPNGCTINSVGNTIIAREGSVPATFDGIYVSLVSNSRVFLKDMVQGSLPNGLNSYINAGGYPADLVGCYIYDPCNKVDVQPIDTWINMTLINGFTAGTNPPQYTKDKYNNLKLRGMIVGANATSGIFAMLPEGYRPPREQTRAVTDWDTASVRPLAIYSSGALVINQSTPLTAGNICLDGVVIDL